MRNFVHSQQLHSETALVHPENWYLFSRINDCQDLQVWLILQMMKAKHYYYYSIHQHTWHLLQKLWSCYNALPNTWRYFWSRWSLLFRSIVRTAIPTEGFSCCFTILRSLWTGFNVIGSVMNATSAKSSSVVMAYWPSRGNQLSNIDYSRMKVGVVQYFFKHRAKFYISGGQVKESEHIFAYIKWKQFHPNQDWFGISATVHLNMNEVFSICSFLPVQRISSKCAFSVIDVDINGIIESVFCSSSYPN